MKNPGSQPESGVLPEYRRPGWVILHLVNPLTNLLVGRMGMDDHNGTRVLEVQGRKSGKWHATPLRVLELDGRRYLVSMSGETQWVKNLRAQGQCRIHLGREAASFRAVELDGVEKRSVLRAYLKRYWSLVSGLSAVDSPDAPDEVYASAARLHPAFRLDDALEEAVHG